MERHIPSDDDPVMRIETSAGDELEMRRENTKLYTFLGKLAVYDHIFHNVSKNEGVYLFNFVNEFPAMREYMIRSKYPAIINMVEVPEHDINAYVRSAMGDIDEIPEDWFETEQPE